MSLNKILFIDNVTWRYITMFSKERNISIEILTIKRHSFRNKSKQNYTIGRNKHELNELRDVCVHISEKYIPAIIIIIRWVNNTLHKTKQFFFLLQNESQKNISIFLQNEKVFNFIFILPSCEGRCFNWCCYIFF